MKSKIRQIACVGLTGVMLATFIAGNALAFAKDGNGGLSADRLDTVNIENLTGKLDLTDVAIKNLNDKVLDGEASGVSLNADKTYNVIVTLEQAPVIDRVRGNGTVKEYLSTPAGTSTQNAIKTSQKRFLSELSKAGVKHTLVNSYNTVTNSVVLSVKGADITKITGVSSVKSVVMSSYYDYPEAAEVSAEKSSATSNPNDVYKTGIYNSEKYVNAGTDGGGVTIAILDTGLDYTHDAFNVLPTEEGMSRQHVADMLANTKAYALSAQNGETISENDLYINKKVPFAYDYADKDTNVYPSYSQHGTHVAGIAAGNGPSDPSDPGYGYTDKDGNHIDEHFVGVAPNAQLVICKVFTDNFDSPDLGGAVSEDILNALEDCVTLGVDVINMSLGTSSGFSSIEIDGDTEGQLMNGVYEKIRNAGVSLVCAASNEYSSGYGSAFGTNLAENPDSGTVGSPSTYTGAMSTASINGQQSYYMNVNLNDGQKEYSEPIFFSSASNANYVKQDFLKMLGVGEEPQTFKYVVISGVGLGSSYTNEVRKQFTSVKNGGYKQEGEKVIAVIKRGTNSFQEKVEIAMRGGLEGSGEGADAVIIYNNVAGTVGISVGDIDNPVPVASVTMDAGNILTSRNRTGTVTLSADYQAGPFMNDYSSWGVTPDLKLKPDITAYGGEITSTVSGGYNEQSGTSMASPNLAGFTALLRGHLKSQGYTGTDLTQLINRMIMSTATIVYNEDGKAYSPRKQGAGLATLDNVFGTGAYLYTVDGENVNDTEEGRPKIELGSDEKGKGVYTLKFHVKNFGNKDLAFAAKSLLMTETLSSDGLSVAEKPTYLTDIPAKWKVNGVDKAEGETFTVAQGASAAIEVTLTLSDAEKKYIKNTFKNGMFVEGFLTLESQTQGQCALNLPFMGFYGDWNAAPMLDYDCYEISEFLQDASYDDETRPKEQVWATQAFASYYNSRYVIPLGSYVYVQDKNAEQIYTDREHAAVSRFNDFVGDGERGNHMTTWRIKSLYAGLLRNAELVTYDIYNTDTGEIVKSDNVYRVNKAVAGGGSAIPAQVLLEFTPDELGLQENGRYAMDFKFYFKAEDRYNPDYNVEENSFSMVFYVDYEAPILENAAIRYVDYKENNQNKQHVYLDLDIHDNHYAQAVMLCRPDEKGESIVLATEYMTPVYNAVKNGTTTVTIEITDLVDEYKDSLYIQVVDYALNYSVYQISFSNSKAAPLPDTFTLAADDKIVEENGEYVLTLGVNETHTIKLDYAGNANLSNFKWDCRSNYVKVNNGEVFAAAVGTATVTVTGKDGDNIKIKVKVVPGTTKLPSPSLEFGTIVDNNEAIVKAAGTVKVNAGQNFKLSLVYTPWYYPTTGKIVWASDNADVAVVDGEGNVKTFDIYDIVDENGNVKSRNAVISATLYEDGRMIAYASVTLSVQDCVTMSGTTLTRYNGTGGDIVLPSDKNIMVIGEEAFKDNDNITSIVFPSSVTQISARAFKNCSALKYIYFIQKDAMPIADADLSLIMKSAFENCPNLELVDLTNVKKISVGRDAFKGCVSLKEVRRMDKIGTMVGSSFEGCTALKEADITGLHTVGSNVFKGCTSLDTVKTAYYSAIGEGMFAGCSSLVSVTVNAPSVGARAFEGCTALTTVNFGSAGANLSFTIGAYAFNSCNLLTSVDFFGNGALRMGDMAFANCANLTQLKNLDLSKTALGDKVFEGSGMAISSAVYDGTKLVLAPSVITSGFAIKAGTTEIAPYAFASSKLASGVTTVNIPASVTKIGEGAFAHLAITSIALPSGLKEIADYTFYNTDSDQRLLTAITVPASVERIGKAAFYGCDKLETLTFESGSALKIIDDEAFSNCQSLTEAVLPDGCATMGDETFYGCTSLKTVTLPSVTKMGARTFRMCTALEEVTFGENATVTGAYTFCPGVTYDAQGNVSVYKSSLKTVNLSGKITAIGVGAFQYCSVMTTINLRNVTEVGAEAFENCTALVTVSGIENLKKIGASAFANCASIETLNLNNAAYIGESAFHSVGFTSLSIPKVEFIGAMAFYGGNATEINLPATVYAVGEAAFADSAYLRAINVDEKNKDFFSENGVLYRNVTDFKTGETVYELNQFPSAKNIDVYTIKEGTVIVNAYAFANLNGTVREVFLPYSVKAIGTLAFYSSGITVYVFECVEAPVLYSEYFENGLSVSSLYSANFEDEFVLHTGLLTGVNKTPASLTIIYPENGQGYNNYVYSKYFDKVTVSDEVMDNTTRALKKEIESFLSVEEINAWNSLAVNDENKSMVKAFSDKVKAAHASYNNITGAKQLELLGSGNVARLLAVENALKPVKDRFGITAKATTLTVSPESTHKTKYIEGETFDMTGLVIMVTYDDYSTETVYASSGEISLVAAYDGVPLRLTSRYVEVTVRGVKTMVAISVSEQGEEPPANPVTKFNPAVIYGPIIGVAAAAAIAVAVIFLIKKLKSAKSAETASRNTEENGNSENNGADNG